MLAPMSASTWIKQGSAAMLTVYTVSRCRTRGESEDHTGEKACKKGSALPLKPSQKSKTGVLVATQKGLVSFNI